MAGASVVAGRVEPRRAASEVLKCGAVTPSPGLAASALRLRGSRPGTVTAVRARAPSLATWCTGQRPERTRACASSSSETCSRPRPSRPVASSWRAGSGSTARLAGTSPPWRYGFAIRRCRPAPAVGRQAAGAFRRRLHEPGRACVARSVRDRSAALRPGDGGRSGNRAARPDAAGVRPGARTRDVLLAGWRRGSADGDGVGNPYGVSLHGSDARTIMPTRATAHASILDSAAAECFVSEALRARAVELGALLRNGAIVPNGVDCRGLVPRQGRAKAQWCR